MSQAKILIVEDEPIVAMDVQRRLQLQGYPTPHVVASGEAAVQMVPELQPDLILMDIMLEGAFDGIEAASRIRQQQSVPIIYLTAYADEDILNRAKITEPFGYILKPFEDRELQTCIEMALYKHAMELRLQENERWHSTTLRSIGDAVISTDGHGVIRLFNPVAELLIGLDAGDALGRPFEQVVHLVREQDEEPVRGLVQLGRERGSVRLSEAVQLVTAAGSRRAVDITVSAIHSVLGNGVLANNGAPLTANEAGGGVVFALRDISGQRKTEEALRQSVRNLRRTLEETVTALAMTTEKRDPYTAGHQQRVAKLASAMGVKMGLESEQIEGLRVAGLLHDIGKIYIPAEILSKPAVLSEMEMGIMKTHSEVGYDILKRVSFPWPVADVVLQHHERIDGSGYPGGLGDKDILLDAKIIMVADVVEAMSSHRPYRAALGVPKALGEITGQRGRRYSADVVDACMSVFGDDGFSFED